VTFRQSPLAEHSQCTNSPWKPNSIQAFRLVDANCRK